MHGFLLIDKESGITSAEVIRRIKRALHGGPKSGQVKIGHAGTLDPDATGLLMILFGHATRLQDEVMGGVKEYQGVIKLGAQTDTDDCSGAIISRSRGVIEESRYPEIEQLLQETFRGQIMQRPPVYSAIKVDGERSYARAREGEIVELEPRPIVIYDSEFSFIDGGRIHYRIRCGSGTYIRGIARDSGPLFGEHSCAESIRRTESGGFSVKGALPSAELTTESIEAAVRPFTELLTQWPRATLSAADEGLIRNGDQRPLLPFRQEPKMAFFSESGGVFALAERDEERGLRLRCVL